ncbi:MAG: hypothetical protein GF417_11700 [Candidatus Latescibacteria bacterium]|nr:hypothetical protein [bacterium]MBD3425089.1 hypothetical protein [Candidatus Latescibacterota bacterium]
MVIRNRGGCGGGSARLSEFGRRMVEAWEKYRREVVREAEDYYSNLMEDILKEEEKK